MDSDLSLLEITAEDDSLLHIPRDDSGVNNTSTIFYCSPLHCHKSVPALSSQTDGRVGAASFKKFSSSVKDEKYKENINGNKSDAPKLNVEPQQMKRKKKGGGYNLRKSFAWNRAFFTEEGVLNPLELSMISGNHSRASKELTMIRDEEENALVSDADIVGASSMLKDNEENLFKPFPEDRKIGASLSQVSDALTKDTIASASLAKRKVFAVNNININKSKRDACPRPIASSSPDTSKAQGNESKVSKIPLPKTHVPVITTAARSGTLGTSCSKRNQLDHSATYVQKNAAVKGLSRNPKSVPINSKFDMADKSSVTRTSTLQARKDINDSISESHPPPRLQHQPVTEAKKGFEFHPPLRICNTGNKKQSTQFQTARPSGLRMPSPSLGFFSQQKASSSHSMLLKSSKPCKPSNTPKLKKVEMDCVNEARGLHPPGKSSETVEGETKNCTPNLRPTDVKSESWLQVGNNQKKEVQCYSLRSGEITEHGKVETIPEYMNNNDKNLLLQSDMDDHLKTKVDGDQFVESHSMCYSSIQRTSIERDDLPTSAQNAIEHEVDVKMKPPVCDAQISNEGSVPQAENGSSSNDCSHSGDIKEYNCTKIARVNSSLGDFSEAVLGISLERILYKSTEGVKDGVGDFDKHEVDVQLRLLNANLSSHCNDSSQLISEAVNQQPQHSHSMHERYEEQAENIIKHEVDVQLRLLNENLSSHCNDSSQLISEAVNQQPLYSHSLDERYEEQAENINSSIEAKINSRSDSESHANGCLVHATTSSSQESPKKPLLQVIDASESVPKIAEMEDCEHTGDVQSSSVHRRSVDNEYDQLIDSKLIQGISSEGTSLPYDLSIAQHDVLGNFDQQARILTSSKTTNSLFENENSVANHSPLLDERDSLEVPANINLDTKDFCGAETPSGLHENNLLAPAITETDDSKRWIENLHVKDTSVMFADENPATCSGNNNPGTSLGNYHFPLVVESMNKESPPDLVADVDFLHVNLNGDLLPAKNACSEEIGNEILFEGVLGQCNNNASEDIILKNHILAASKIKDGSLDLDERTKHLQIDGADQVTSEIVEVEPNHKVNGSNIVSSIQGNEGQIVDWKCIERCSSSVRLKSQVADNLISRRQIPNSSEAGSLKRKILSEEAEISVSGKEEICNANVQNPIAEDSAELFHLKKSGTKRKQDVPTVIPPPNVAPFSDEWLAAMEAAGEEILTMKGGAVQNSPTEKPQQEPGPWSPVRRKNQAIGPYDCTKCTNMNIPDSCQ